MKKAAIVSLVGMVCLFVIVFLLWPVTPPTASSAQGEQFKLTPEQTDAALNLQYALGEIGISATVIPVGDELIVDTKATPRRVAKLVTGSSSHKRKLIEAGFRSFTVKDGLLFGHPYTYKID